MELSETAHNYIRGLYKKFTAKGMNLEEMRYAMTANGLRRNIFQLTYDLEERYTEFKGYAAKHEAPRPPTLTEVAADEEAKKGKPTRRLEPKPTEPKPTEPKPSVPYQSGLGGLAGAIHRAQRSQTVN